MNKTFNKRNLTALIVFACSFVLLFVALCRGDVVYENKFDGEPLLTLGTDDIIEKNDCRVENGVYIPDGDSPYIVFKTDAVKASYARFAYSENDVPVIAAQLDFGEKESDFDADKTPANFKNNRYNLKDGFIFKLNKKANSYFRLHLTERCKIGGLEFYAKPIVTQESMAPVSSARYLAVFGASIIIALVCWLLYARLSGDELLTLNKADEFFGKHRRLIFFAVLLIVALFSVNGSLSTFTGGAVKYFKIFAFAAIVAATALLYYLLYIRKCKIQTAFLVSAVIMGVFCMIMFTPFTVPDEPSHMASAYRISNFMTFDFGQDGKMLIRRSDINAYNNYAQTGLTRSYYGTLKKCSEFFCSDSALVSHRKILNSGAPFGYIFAALGITVARILNLGPLPLFYMGRLFNYAAYVAMVCFAIKKIPVGKIAVCAVALLPMSMQLAISYSYDPIVLAFALMFTAQIVYLIYKPETVTRKDIITASVLAALLAPSKLVYTPLVLLAVLIPRRNFKSKRSAITGKTAIVAIGFLSLIVLQFLVFSTGVSADSGIIKWAGEPGYTVTRSLAYPFNTIKIFVKTFAESLSFYISSMVGNLFGWLSVSVDWIFFAAATVLLLFSFFSKKGDPSEHIRPTGRILILATLAASSLLILASMYLGWTPLSYTSIVGVQGRYFLPLLLPAALVIRSLPISLGKNSDRHIMLLIFFSNILLFSNMLNNLPIK